MKTPTSFAILPILILTSAAVAGADEPPLTAAWLDAVQFNNVNRDRAAWRGIEAQLKTVVVESGWAWLPAPSKGHINKDCESSVACLLEHAKASGAQYVLVTSGAYSVAQKLIDFSGSVRLFHVKEGFVSAEQPIECIVCTQNTFMERLQSGVRQLFSSEEQRIRSAALAQSAEEHAAAPPKDVSPPAEVIAPPPLIAAQPRQVHSNTLGWSSVAVGAVATGLGIHWLLIDGDRADAACGLQARTCDVYSTHALGWTALGGGVALLGVGAYLLIFQDHSANVSLHVSPQGGAIKGVF